MKLIVGLGNPGRKYEKTRHNLGFAVIDALLQELTPVKKTTWQEDKKSNSLIAKVGGLILVKPQVLMNASGSAVKKLASSFRLPASNIYVVHDDLDLPLGKIKIRKGGGSGGHKGVESIIKFLETTDFVRFRLGIGHPRQKPKGHLGGQAGPGSSDKEIERYVLSPLKRGEKDEARRMVKKTVKAIKIALEKSLETAMNRFN